MTKIPVRDHKWYGYRRDARDDRDIMFTPHPGQVVPAAIDLRDHCPPVMDQGPYGSCTAHGITGALRYGFLKTGQADTPLSRMMLYADERIREGTFPADAGAEIRDGIKSTQVEGIAVEKLWPYQASKMKTKPTPAVYKAAVKFKFKYSRVEVDVDHLRAAIAAGWPVVVGIDVYESFESDAVSKTGVVPMPVSGDKNIGGHCMYAVGYGQKPDHFTVRNSWNTDWGDHGDCYIPYGYLGSTKYGSDYWTITA